jgi:hypothetical protein
VDPFYDDQFHLTAPPPSNEIPIEVPEALFDALLPVPPTPSLGPPRRKKSKKLE